MGEPGRQAETNPLLAHCGRHGRDYLEREARSVLRRATVLVRAVIRRFLQELVDQESICTMYLNAIKARTLNGVPRRRHVQLHILSDLGFRQRARGGWWRCVVGVVDVGWEWHAPCGDVLEGGVLSPE